MLRREPLITFIADFVPRRLASKLLVNAAKCRSAGHLLLHPYRSISVSAESVAEVTSAGNGTVLRGERDAHELLSLEQTRFAAALFVGISRSVDIPW